MRASRRGATARLPALLAAVGLAFLPQSAQALGDEIRVHLLAGSYLQILGPSERPTSFWLYALLVNPTDRPILMVESHCPALPAGATPAGAVPAGAVPAGAVPAGDIDLCRETWIPPAGHPASKSRVHRIALEIPPAYLGEVGRKRFASDDLVRVVGFSLTQTDRANPAGLSFRLQIRTGESGILSSGLYRLEPITARRAGSVAP